jgi:bidirectional [NiFe] hydrogenase diaphorase subunit
LLEELCDLVRNTSLCGLGQSAPNGVLTTLRYFRHEYESHIAGQPCGTCRPEKKEAEL